MSAELVKRVRIKRKKNRLYYLGKDGHVWSFNRKTKNKKCEVNTGIQREPGYIYFIDANGDIARKLRKS